MLCMRVRERDDQPLHEISLFSYRIAGRVERSTDDGTIYSTVASTHVSGFSIMIRDSWRGGNFLTLETWKFFLAPPGELQFIGTFVTERLQKALISYQR